MLVSHLPLLQVVVPLIAAPICVILHRPYISWLFASAVSVLTFIIACLLFHQAGEQPVTTYAIGGWAAPAGIEYYLDRLTAFLLLIITGLGSVILLGARYSLEDEIATDRQYLVYCAYLLNLTGLLGVLMTGDVFNIFVFIEIASLSSYALVSISRNRRSLYAAFKYLIFGTLGASFILIAIGLLYAVTGTLNIIDLAERLPRVENTRTILTAMVFFTIGIGLKAAIFPLHLWLPDAYHYSPSIVSTFLAGTSTKVFIYVLIRFIFTLFGIELSLNQVGMTELLMCMAVVGILYGSVQAIRQDSIKRCLAFSSIAQIGYMILALSLGSVAGLTASLIHVFNHAIIKACLFLCVANIIYHTQTDSIQQLAGIGRRMPLTIGLFTVAGLSLIGVPLTAGFISKWYLVQAAIEGAYPALVVLIVFSSILALVYIGRILEVAYFHPETEAVRQQHTERTSPRLLYISLCVLAAACLYFGVQTTVTVGSAQAIASELFGVAL